MDEKIQKELDLLKASYEMYENTKRDTVEHMKNVINEDGTKRFSQAKIDEQVKVIENAQEEVYNDFISLGGNPDDLKKKKSGRKKTKVEDIVSESILGLTETETKPQNVSNGNNEGDKATKAMFGRDTDAIKKVDTREVYDMIDLPSKGECYKNKISKIPVSYLTAYDENMIIAPNLYRDNLIIDTMLEQKIMNDEIPARDMLEGDREAIVLFLRASGYGSEYPITVTDDRTGEEFDTVIDLSKLEFKPFTLKGDDRGYFEYELPFSKDIVKFRFLTHQNNLDLKKFEAMENETVKKAKLLNIAEELTDFIENEETLNKTEKIKVREAIKTINQWGENIDEEELLYTHSVTNRLEMSVMSVNNITDRAFIKKYVRNMNVKDSSALRKYINDNEPGIDYNITVERPESLGGGSMPIFLQLDQFIFLNIA